MNLEEACRAVLGRAVANAIIADMGMHWCVLTAVAAAKMSHPRPALDALRTRLDEIRRANTEEERGPLENNRGGLG
jgi:hypothetical protein